MSMEESMVKVPMEATRPDIDEVRHIPEKIKSELVYKDDDELEAGMQKVQPLPFLDEEIEKYKQQIWDSAEKAEDDDVPAQLLGKVNNVIKVAKEGKTTLFKASELLEFTSEAFLYARKASRDKTALKKESVDSLKKYDEMFCKFLEFRIKASMEEASEQQEKCFSQLENAVDNAEEDYKEQETWTTNEDKELTENALGEIHSTVKETIDDERSELKMMKDRCNLDVEAIDMGMKSMHTLMDSATAEYISDKEACEKDLEGNRKQQRELEEQLKALRDEEEKLKTKISSKDELQKLAVKIREEADRDLVEWRGKIEELGTRTRTALTVMEDMQDCTDMIMDDAKKWKNTRQETLKKQELESLLILRDCLMASGALHKMVLSDSENNASLCKQEIVNVEKEKKKAAKTGFAEKVKDLNTKIESYKGQMTIFESKIEETKKKLKEITNRLEEVDDKLRAIDNPVIKLDSLTDRFKRRKKQVEDAYEGESTAGIPFTSLVNYTGGGATN